ncbi:MAG: hypothetical protein QM708_13380 [Propioniciclava sp.]|uniref:hypothetical protein n=1 Tax=Propioniciclava sp. TaxID=2038686 RepID=UPI0039E48FC7
MKRLAPLALVAGLVLTGCTISIGGTASSAPPAPDTSVGAGAAGKTSFDPGQVVPGYAPGQFPPVPMFPLPDTAVVSEGMEKVRAELEANLPDLPGVKVTAVQCGADGNYLNPDSSLVLYGDGSGSYVGPDGSYTRGPDGSGTSVGGEVVIMRDGNGGGQYVNGDLSITSDGSGSGAYVDGNVTITLDGEGPAPTPDRWGRSGTWATARAATPSAMS